MRKKSLNEIISVVDQYRAGHSPDHLESNDRSAIVDKQVGESQHLESDDSAGYIDYHALLVEKILTSLYQLSGDHNGIDSEGVFNCWALLKSIESVKFQGTFARQYRHWGFGDPNRQVYSFAELRRYYSMPLYRTDFSEYVSVNSDPFFSEQICRWATFTRLANSHHLFNVLNQVYDYLSDRLNRNIYSVAKNAQGHIDSPGLIASGNGFLGEFEPKEFYEDSDHASIFHDWWRDPYVIEAVSDEFDGEFELKYLECNVVVDAECVNNWSDAIPVYCLKPDHRGVNGDDIREQVYQNYSEYLNHFLDAFELNPADRHAMYGWMLENGGQSNGNGCASLLVHNFPGMEKLACCMMDVKTQISINHENNSLRLRTRLVQQSMLAVNHYGELVKLIKDCDDLNAEQLLDVGSSQLNEGLPPLAIIEQIIEVSAENGVANARLVEFRLMSQSSCVDILPSVELDPSVTDEMRNKPGADVLNPSQRCYVM